MAYAQWVAITIYPSNFEITLKNVAHSWGKFYKDGNKDNEIQPSEIEGTKIAAGNSYVIYACGRSDAAAGTEGSFDIYDGATVVGTYTWDCPWGSKTNSSNWSPNGPQPPFNNYITQQSGANLNSGALGNVTLQTTKVKTL
ncbi:aegerolysin family protein [Flavobacterium sp.]|uniref:aegerolysin family protein n=1 Tax=Flavobacterium sp. TaxID=239 RepID=UPI00286D8ABF|nr:aegerolysin family protein [Flavobacterium sp.]